MAKAKTNGSAKKAGKTIKGKGWKKSITIANDKYEMISKAVLKSLGARPLRFSELVDKVKKQLQVGGRRPRLPQTKFTGSVSWYTVSTLRALENEGKVTRTKGKVVTYSRREN